MERVFVMFAGSIRDLQLWTCLHEAPWLTDLSEMNLCLLCFMTLKSP